MTGTATTIPGNDLLRQMQNAAQTGYTLYPVWRELLADCDTPVSAYRKLAQGDPYTFLLESVEGGEKLARFSFIGLYPETVLLFHGAMCERINTQSGAVTQVDDVADPLKVIEDELLLNRVAPFNLPLSPGSAAPRLIGGAVGYLGYEIAARYEPIAVPEQDSLQLPDACIIFTNTFVIFDHIAHRAILLTHADLRQDHAANLRQAQNILDELQQTLETAPFRKPAAQKKSAAAHAQKWNYAEDKARFIHMTNSAKEAIFAGDAFQIVPSRRTSRVLRCDPFSVYRALRALNPSPYQFYLDCKDFVIAGASPEMLARVENGEVAAHPIAGTRPRGENGGADAAFEAELRYDPKEQAEHVMLVDLGRNDLGRVAEPGTVRVTQMMDVERYSHVMHLVSHITGKLRSGLTAFDAVRSVFPAGTLTGAPKIKAMQIIAELEGIKRGVYGGGVGYFGYNGNADMAIAIRTLVIKDGVAYAQSGAGIVADSEPEAEFMETERKAQALWQAVEMAETFNTNNKTPKSAAKAPVSKGGKIHDSVN